MLTRVARSMPQELLELALDVLDLAVAAALRGWAHATKVGRGRSSRSPDFTPLPTGRALRYWLARLPEGERRVLEALIVSYPDAVVRTDLDAAVGYKRSTRDLYLQALQRRRLIASVHGTVRAADELFD